MKEGGTTHTYTHFYAHMRLHTHARPLLLSSGRPRCLRGDEKGSDSRSFVSPLGNSCYYPVRIFPPQKGREPSQRDVDKGEYLQDVPGQIEERLRVVASSGRK